MKLNYRGFFDFLFPLSIDEHTLISTTSEDFLKKLHVQSILPGLYALASYKDPHLRAAIHLLKFHHHPHALHLLSVLLQKYLSSLVETEYVLLPIPLSKKRMHERGYNQVEVLAKEACKELTTVTLLTRSLYKVRHTEPQSSLSRKKRLQNVRGVFALHDHQVSNVAGKHIIILDDVTTTGSTLLEAKKALARANAASITCVAVAH